MSSKTSDPKKQARIQFMSEESDQFKKLMEELDDKTITKDQNDKIEKSDERYNKSEKKVEFIEETDWQPDSIEISQKQKYSGLKKAPPSNPPKRKISKGFQPEAALDLHGETREDALIKVEHFIQNSRYQGFRTTLIITGRGRSSNGGEGILKTAVWEWLEYQNTRLNLYFQKAPAFLGGEGAILIFL